MKKIIIFSLAYHPFVGGAEVAIKEITDRLPDHEYHMITNKFQSVWADQEKIGNIIVHRIGTGKKWDKYFYAFRAIFYAKKLHAKIHFDFAWSMMPFYAGLAALGFKTLTRIPYLLTDQSGDSDEFLKKRTWFWEPIYKQIYRQPKISQVISQFLGKRSRSMGNRGEIILVPNGVDLAVFQKSLTPEKTAQLKKELHIQDDETVLITTSRLAYKNAIDDIIKSVNWLIYKMGIKTKLIIIGKGPDEQKLKDLAASQSVSDQVIFLGFKTYQELPPYVEMADIFIRPSLSEGFGNSFVEAMAVDTPIIGTPVGGIPDFLKDGETGLFCEVRNPSSIAKAVERYTRDKDLYQKIVDQGRELAISKYSWDTIAPQMNKIFEMM